jgi:O-antigen ligase
MSSVNHLILYWRRYTVLERLLVLFPLTLVTPSFFPFITSLTHDGETTHEFVITIYMFIMLTVGSILQPKLLMKLPRFGSVEFFVCLFALWTACSLVWTSSIGATLDQIVIWVDYAILMLIAATCLRRRSKIGLATMLMVAGVLMAVIKLLAYAMLEGNQPENSPLFKNIGVEPEILVTLLPILWIVILSTRRRQVLITVSICSLVIMMASLTTYQRAPLLGLIGAITGITIFVLAGWYRPRTMYRAAFLVLVICLSYTIQIQLPSKFEGFSGSEQMAMKTVDKEVLKSSAAGRFILWDSALEMLIQHPVLGVGGGAYKAKYAEYRAMANQHSRLLSTSMVQSFRSDQSDGAASYFRAHNEFLQVLGELGLVGGLILFGVIFALGKKIFIARNFVVSTIVMSGTTAFLISSSFSSFSFRWIPCGIAFFLLVSLTSSQETKLICTGIYARKWAPYVLMGCLSFCCIRSGQIFVSQYFESQADVGASADNKSDYQRAIAINPYNFTARFKLGWMWYLSMKPEKAVPLLETAMDQGVNDVTSFQILALAQAQIGEKEKAQATLQKGLTMAPSSVFLRVISAELLKRNGEFDRSRQLIAEARKINPAYTDATEILWTAEKINANKYILVANKMGNVWAVMTANRGADLDYK